MYNEELIKNTIINDSFYHKNKKECKTIQDKMRWLNVNNLTELKINCADKILVKEYAKNTIGYDICPKTYYIYDSFDDININDLPNSFVLKMNNGCAKNIYCYDKSTFNLNNYADTINEWFTIIPGIKTKEYQYSGITPKIFAEELLINSNTESLIDYRFWCINNNVKFIAINSGRGWGGQYFVDKNFNKININNALHELKDAKINFYKPENFNNMIYIAEKLSKPFKFVRIDMYNINGKIYLGEMTFSPSGYNGHFITDEGKNEDIKYGNLLKI